MPPAAHVIILWLDCVWTDYFKYEYAIVDNTLFIKGVDENDMFDTRLFLCR